MADRRTMLSHLAFPDDSPPEGAKTFYAVTNKNLDFSLKAAAQAWLEKINKGEAGEEEAIAAMIRLSSQYFDAICTVTVAEGRKIMNIVLRKGTKVEPLAIILEEEQQS